MNLELTVMSGTCSPFTPQNHIVWWRWYDSNVLLWFFRPSLFQLSYNSIRIDEFIKFRPMLSDTKSLLKSINFHYVRTHVSDFLFHRTLNKSFISKDKVYLVYITLHRL